MASAPSSMSSTVQRRTGDRRRVRDARGLPGAQPAEHEVPVGARSHEVHRSRRIRRDLDRRAPRPTAPGRDEHAVRPGPRDVDIARRGHLDPRLGHPGAGGERGDLRDHPGAASRSSRRRRPRDRRPCGRRRGGPRRTGRSRGPAPARPTTRPAPAPTSTCRSRARSRATGPARCRGPPTTPRTHATCDRPAASTPKLGEPSMPQPSPSSPQPSPTRAVVQSAPSDVATRIPLSV